MDLALSVLALLLALSAGYGVSAPFRRGQAANGVVETVTVSMLLGLLFLSVLSFGVSLVLAGPVQQWTITATCIALGIVGVVLRRQHRGTADGTGTGARSWTRSNAVDLLLGVVIVAELAYFAVWSMQLGLGWDGLVVWNIKARQLCLNDFAMPTAYFSDLTRQWSHPSYPFFTVFVQSWLYQWIDSCDQGIIKILSPVYLALCLGLLYVGSRRLGATTRAGLFLAAAAIFVPFIIRGDGGASNGGPASSYADFPLGVFYLAAVVYLLDYIETDAPWSARIAALSTMALPWIKQEGAVLVLTIVAILLPFAIQRRRILASVLIVVPCGVLALAWRLFLQSVGTPPSVVFLPMTPSTFLTNADRLVEIVPAVVAELLSISHWSVLWPVVLVAIVLHQTSGCYARRVVLPLAVVLPLVAYSLTYIFSSWVPFMAHLNSSIARLVLQLVPCALLVAGSLLGSCQHCDRRRAEDERRATIDQEARKRTPTLVGVPDPGRAEALR